MPVSKLRLRAFQHGASEWQEWDRRASDRDGLRRKAYKLKRTLIRNL
jgi:hypothetical protein